MARKIIDWAACEAEYRTGTFSNRQLAAKYDCTETAIRDRAKRYGWEKDLTDAVRRATNAKLLRTELRNPNAREDDTAIINVASNFRVSVVTSHRRDIEQLHGLKRIIAERLSLHLTGGIPDGPFIGDKESPGDLLEKLSRVTGRLIPLERQAHNLDANAEEDRASASIPSGSALQRILDRLDGDGGS